MENLEEPESGSPAKGGGGMEKIKIEQHTFMGSLWLAGWLFAIGFLHLSFWRGVFAIVLWPYYLGVHLSTVWH